MNRKKKLRIIQLSLLLMSLLILVFSYSNQFKFSDKTIISKEIQKKVDQQLSSQSNEGDTFYNISFSGLDLSGNRYILNAVEANNDKIKPEIIYMKEVDAIFYFKDGTNLKIFADKGVYNNKSLNMVFEKNIEAFLLSGDPYWIVIFGAPDFIKDIIPGDMGYFVLEKFLAK